MAVSASRRTGVRVWEWIDTIKDGYVVLRIQIEAGWENQLLLYENGRIEVGPYNSDGEENDWSEVV